MELKNKSIETLTIDGGWLALDFVNTISNRNVEPPQFDYLTSYPIILDWTKRVNLLKTSEVRILEKYALEHPIESAKSWIRALEAREMLFTIFQCIVKGKTPATREQNLFNAWLSRSLRKSQVEFVDASSSIRASWNIALEDLDKPIYLIIKSAYDLLLGGQLNRIKECGTCGWLFLDKSKNGSRRWCNMDTCGSQQKSKNYYHRKKSKQVSLITPNL